jgi:hypothetical protein
MAFLVALLVCAPESADVADRVPEVVQLLKAGETSEAVARLKEIATHKENHAEAASLVRLIRTGKVKKPPEVMEACFLALKGIGSRKVTRQVIALLKHPTLRKESAVRIGVCRALGGSADPAGAEALIGRMRDKDDHVIAAAAEAAGSFRYARDSIRKDLFKTILDIYESNWNLKNSVDPELRVERARAERRWEIVERPMERSLQLLSNVTKVTPPEWRRWWNKNKKRRWIDLDQ